MSKTLYIKKIPSPLGVITAASDGENLTGLWFEGQKHFGSTLKGAFDEKNKRTFVLTAVKDPDSQMFMPTVLDDMLFGPMNYGLSREEAENKADAILQSLGIIELKHKYNHRISGGEKRMAAIATILAMEPEAVIMDEPTVALDPYNRRIVMNAIRAMQNTRVIASHDLDMILDLCDRVILISGGRIAADDTSETILYDKELLEKNRLELPLRLSR